MGPKRQWAIGLFSRAREATMRFPMADHGSATSGTMPGSWCGQRRRDPEAVKEFTRQLLTGPSDLIMGSLKLGVSKVPRKETEIETFAAKFKKQFEELGKRLRIFPDGDPLIWLIQNQLAATRRPLRDHRDFETYVYQNHLPPQAGPIVIAWLERILKAEVRSVICLLPDWQLRRYLGLQGMSDGLLALYESRGLEVRQVACHDPRHEKVQKRWLEQIKPRAYDAFSELAKPVLLHCSSGIDRSSPIAAYIACRLRDGS